MIFMATQEPLKLNQEEQKILRAFGRTPFRRKSDLAIESLLTPSQIDMAVKNLVKEGLAKIKKTSDQDSELDQRVYLTGKGNQVRRRIGKNAIEYPTKIEPDINKKLEEKIKSLK